jgi:hypothetical protein
MIDALLTLLQIHLTSHPIGIVLALSARDAVDFDLSPRALSRSFRELGSRGCLYASSTRRCSFGLFIWDEVNTQ